MKRNVWVLGCLCLIVLTGCTSSVEHGEKKNVQKTEQVAFEVTLPDSGVELAVSRLPAGIAKDDISIEPIDPIQFGLTTDIQETDFLYGIRGFDLQPDGTEFEQPVILKIPFEGEMPTYFHLHQGKVSLIDGVTYSLRDGGNIALIPLDSFSQVIEWRSGANTTDIDFQVTDSYVGEPVMVDIAVKVNYIADDGDGSYRRINKDSVTFDGTLWADGAAGPGVVNGRPPTTKIGETYTLKSDSDFECIREGKTKFEYKTRMFYRGDIVFPGDGLFGTDVVLDDRGSQTFLEVSRTMTCHPRRKPVEPPEVRCGDGWVNQPSESCDMKDVMGKTCRSYGFSYGSLGCTEFCEIDTSKCSDPIPTISCSENTRESSNEYTETQGPKECRNDCPGSDTCDPDTCTCLSTAERQEKIYGTPTVNRDRVLHPEKYPKLPTTKKINVIKYGLSYIPVDQLKKVTGEECEKAEHWHADGEIVGLNGMLFEDPDVTGCGFGKTSEVPEIEIEVDLSKEELQKLIQEQDATINPPKEEENDVREPLPGVDDEEENDGKMVQIEPPSLVIPAR